MGTSKPTSGSETVREIAGESALRSVMLAEDSASVTVRIPRDMNVIATAVFPPFRESRNYVIRMDYDAGHVVHRLTNPHSARPQYTVISRVDQEATGTSASLSISVLVDDEPATNMLPFKIGVLSNSQIIAWHDFEIGREPAIFLSLVAISD